MEEYTLNFLMENYFIITELSKGRSLWGSKSEEIGVHNRFVMEKAGNDIYQLKSSYYIPCDAERERQLIENYKIREHPTTMTGL